LIDFDFEEDVEFRRSLALDVAFVSHKKGNGGRGADHLTASQSTKPSLATEQCNRPLKCRDNAELICKTAVTGYPSSWAYSRSVG